ncbi:5649_t:CDS:2 [Funneliformis geosporum]|uniref:5649_t:CDS:1 n=1 Tax=Funneliformis geosporum TaxID=1117311 RepID=A0A9W4SPZ4_9GLOM|nr:5649_t:CDS:2 [Funneliformis geosporum]
MDKNVRKIETTISSVHVKEVKRRSETSNQAKQAGIQQTGKIYLEMDKLHRELSRQNSKRQPDKRVYDFGIEWDWDFIPYPYTEDFPEIDNDDSDYDENKSDDVLLQSESKVGNDNNSAQMFNVIEDADEVGVHNHQTHALWTVLDLDIYDVQLDPVKFLAS